MQVSQIIGDARSIFSECPDDALYRRIARALFECSNMGVWDWNTVLQYITLNCEQLQAQGGQVALPAFVEKPLAMTLDCYPAFPRNRWFVHHINGPGERTNINSYKAFWDDKGETCTIRNLNGVSTLVAANLNAADAALSLRVYGLDDSGNVVYDDAGAPGILLAMNVPSTVIFSSITSVYRPAGAGVITLTQVSTGDLLGYYYPDETNPRYQLVRIPKTCKTVTITYKRSIPQIFTDQDWLPISNVNAIIAAMWYIYYIDKNDYENAEKARANAKRSLSEEQSMRTLGTPVGIQIQEFSRRQASDRLWGPNTNGFNGGWW